jgi:hypothetical protein
MESVESTKLDFHDVGPAGSSVRKTSALSAFEIS